MTKRDKIIVKAIIFTIIEYTGAIIAGASIFFGVLYIIGWLAEYVAPKLPFWLVWAVFFIMTFGLLFGTLASSPGASKNQQKK